MTIKDKLLSFVKTERVHWWCAYANLLERFKWLPFRGYLIEHALFVMNSFVEYHTKKIEILEKKIKEFEAKLVDMK